jgi:3-hydroxyisobutyrate dehydrogenase-like beta-hydroxyacid dehydrogenase
MDEERLDQNTHDEPRAANHTPRAHTVGFIGVGVMGEPMCRNLKRKSGARVIAFDRDPAPLERLRRDGVLVAASIGQAVEPAGVVFLSLPSGAAVDEVVHGKDGILSCIAAGQIVVDTSTSPVDLTRTLRVSSASGRYLHRCARRAHACRGGGRHAGGLSRRR